MLWIKIPVNTSAKNQILYSYLEEIAQPPPCPSSKIKSS